MTNFKKLILPIVLIASINPCSCGGVVLQITEKASFDNPALPTFYDSASAPLSTYFVSDNPILPSLLAPVRDIGCCLHKLEFELHELCRVANLVTETMNTFVVNNVVGNDDLWIGATGTLASTLADYRWSDLSSVSYNPATSSTFDPATSIIPLVPSKCIFIRQVSSADPRTWEDESCLSLTTFKHALCEIYIPSACSILFLCKNGGVCVNQLPLRDGKYMCNCLPGFTGDHCEFAICYTSTLLLGSKTLPLTGPTEVLTGNSATVTCEPGHTVRKGLVTTEDLSYDVECLMVLLIGVWDISTNLGYNCVANPCLNYCQNDGICINLIYKASCQCQGGWAGETCTENADECASAPCYNQGTCEQLPLEGFRCVCLQTFSGDTCTDQIGTCGLQTTGERASRTTSMTLQTISSASIIIGLTIILVVFVMMGDFSIARMYHMVQEISLLIAHALLIWGRSTTAFDTAALCDAEGTPEFQAITLSPSLCKLVAISLHYVYLVYFSALLLEAIYNYVIYTMVLTRTNIGKKYYMVLLCFGIPLIPVILTVVFLLEDYTNETTCWLDFSTWNAVIELAPLCIMAALTVIISEATSMRKFYLNPSANKSMRTSSITNSRGTLMLAPLNLSAWLLGVLAVYESSLFFYTLEVIVNGVILVVIFMFHTVGNAKARKIIRTLCCCCLK